ncbi:thymidine kinase [Bacillaceae bacterium SIJ1]|uniref:thymidine kinase n=1 Tax=Litoribacterium kuwaitense TaxID=1398745 RepID=UPI0013EC43C7|nr:thymidine kinase [Litoribacterium kuwaitense]NGP44716.1 thymidine kinase [Litoribacterium kuwaitense]
MNEEVSREIGSIAVICGAMFSGKTETLIGHVRRIREAGEEIQVFKPSLDHRYSASAVVSHNGKREVSQTLLSSEAVQQSVDPKVPWVAIDEVQFFDAGIVEVICSLAFKGHHVIAAGLDLDFKGEPFPIVAQLLAFADHVTKLHGRCAQCGALSSRTQRLVKGKPAQKTDPLVVIAGEDAYEPRCIRCHVIRTSV